MNYLKNAKKDLFGEMSNLTNYVTDPAKKVIAVIALSVAMSTAAMAGDNQTQQNNQFDNAMSQSRQLLLKLENGTLHAFQSVFTHSSTARDVESVMSACDRVTQALEEVQNAEISFYDIKKIGYDIDGLTDIETASIVAEKAWRQFEIARDTLDTQLESFQNSGVRVDEIAGLKERLAVINGDTATIRDLAVTAETMPAMGQNVNEVLNSSGSYSPYYIKHQDTQHVFGTKKDQGTKTTIANINQTSQNHQLAGKVTMQNQNM